MKKIAIGVIIFAVGLVVCFAAFSGMGFAQGYSGEQDIMARLDTLAKNQADILAAINSMKGDINIIKIRVTQNQ